MTASLTKRQRQILYLMKKRGFPTIFFGHTRGFGWNFDLARSVLLIKAYMQPELFLKRRGLIELDPRPRNTPQPHYRLTDAGHERAARIKEMPR